ncbi:MAG: exo-alpha-sialidase [Verrucomicrobiota bacterium]
MILRLLSLILLSVATLHAADNATLKALQAADDERVSATVAADRARLADLFSDDLRYAHSTGTVDTKTSLIETLTSGRTRYESIRYEERTFDMLSPSVALMTGRAAVKVTAAGVAADGVLSFLAVWCEEKGKWRFRAWQSCKVPPQTSAATPPASPAILPTNWDPKRAGDEVLSLRVAEPAVIDLKQRNWQGIPGLERTAKGRVYVSWFTGGTKEPDPLNTVVLSHSDDGGKTFSAPQAMGLPLNDGTRCYDPCLWIDPKGRLWYIFNRGNKDSAKHDVRARICEDPDATEPVWGAEFRVGYDVPFAFRMNKVTVLSTGEWLMPVTLAEKPVLAWCTGYNDQQTPTLHGVGISTDEGRTWKLHGAVKSRPWALENMIVELKDGRLWMLIRTSSGVLWQSYSTDKGRTWSEGTASTIKSPGSRFFIRRLASGNLLLVNHYKFTGRSHLTAQLSTDDGKTWNDGLLLDERSGVSYPDGVQDKDGLIWITYDRDRGGAGEVLLAKFKEEDAAAGRNVSGAVSLKQVVNKLNKPTILPVNWDPKAAADKVMASLLKVTAQQAKGAHDAEFVCVGDRAYIVEHDNDVQPGHGAGEAQYCVLSIVNLKTRKVEKTIPMAKSEQVFDNVTLPKGMCFVPRIIRKDDHTLRTYFCSQPAREQALTWYRDFDLGTQTFEGSIHKAKLKTAAGVFDMEPRHFHADAVAQGFTRKAVNQGLFIFDSFKEFDGRTYVALNNFPGKQNALAVLHDDLLTFEVIGHYNEPQTEQLSESAVNRLPDGTWMAICRNDKGNYHFTTSRDGRSWTVGRPMPFVPNGLNSKPTFDRFGDVYHLGWQENTKVGGCSRSVFNVDVSKDGVHWVRKYRFETAESFQYPTFRQHEGAVWLTVTQSDHKGTSDRIMFGRLE